MTQIHIASVVFIWIIYKFVISGASGGDGIMENLTSNSEGPAMKRPRKKAEELAPSQPVAGTSQERRSTRRGRGRGPTCKPTTALGRWGNDQGVSDSEEPEPSLGWHGRGRGWVRRRGKAPQAILPQDSSSLETGPSRGRSGQGRGRGRGAPSQTSPNAPHQESEEEPGPS